MPSTAVPGRAARIRALITENAGDQAVTTAHLCQAALTATGCDHAALCLATGSDERALIHATDELASYLDGWQFTVGEGPCLQAWKGAGPVLIADLDTRPARDQWPVYTAGALEAGVRAQFALPLQIGAIRVGVLDLYRTKPGALSSEQYADALAFAAAALSVLLSMVHPEGADAEVVGTELAGADRPWPIDGLGAGRVEVYQATGMIAVQLGVGLPEALMRLRARAFTSGIPLAEIAGQVVARTLRFVPDSDPDPVTAEDR